MRRLSISLFFSMFALLACTASLAAQTVEILPQIGISFPSYSGDEIDSDTGIGFVAGGKLRVGGRFYVEPGIFWATGEADVTDDEGTTDKFRISDVRIPLVLGLKVIKSRVVALRIFGGAYPAFAGSVSDNDFDPPITDEDLKGTLWSGRVGAGLDVTLVAIDVGYDFGLTDIFEDPEMPSVKRNMPFIEAGLRFGF